MKTKEELIKLGMKPGRRIDTFYIVGQIYDLAQTAKNFLELIPEINNIREYLNEHREAIDYLDKDIILVSSIERVLQEDFGLFVDEPIVGKEKSIELKNMKIEKPKQTKTKTIKLAKPLKSKYDQTIGIYGIFVDEKIIYIGKTISGFKKRFQQHKSAMADESNHLLLYQRLRKYKEQGKIIQMRVLIDINDLKIINKKAITRTDIKMMELALISVFQPECNIEGVSASYDFGKY